MHCDYCGESGHDFTRHPEAVAEVREFALHPERFGVYPNN
jgi:hypothetical protein